jgi:hypothetical protein
MTLEMNDEFGWERKEEALRKLVLVCACSVLAGVSIAGIGCWHVWSRGKSVAIERKERGQPVERNASNTRSALGQEQVGRASSKTAAVSSVGNRGLGRAADVATLSSEDALKLATARLALAKQSGELLPSDLDDVVALQRRMNDKERTISVQQVQELLSSRDVDTSALALPE